MKRLQLIRFLYLLNTYVMILACMWLHLFGLVYDLWLHSIILTVPLADHLFFQSVELARMQVLWQLYFSCRCRHAGDLGNIEADSEGQAEVTITDYVVSLMGQYSVIGRTLEVCKHHWFLSKWELEARTKVRLFWQNLLDRWNAYGLLLAVHVNSNPCALHVFHVYQRKNH